MSEQKEQQEKIEELKKRIGELKYILAKEEAYQEEPDMALTDWYDGPQLTVRGAAYLKAHEVLSKLIEIIGCPLMVVIQQEQLDHQFPHEIMHLIGNYLKQNGLNVDDLEPVDPWNEITGC